jgi:hypothetical protein
MLTCDAPLQTSGADSNRFQYEIWTKQVQRLLSWAQHKSPFRLGSNYLKTARLTEKEYYRTYNVCFVFVYNMSS